MTILAVDDDEDVVRLIEIVLTIAGYTVLHANCADDALSLLENHHATIHLLLTDVRMQTGGDGYDLADAMRKIRPAIKVLYMSGFTDDERLRQEIAVGKAGFMQKPFSRKNLLKKVEEVLGVE